MQEETKNFFQKNWLKIIIAIAVLIIAIPTGYYFIVFQRQQQEQTNNINLQTKCATQAKKFFDNIKSMANDINYTYKNHYSINLNRCYVLIHGIGVSGIGMSDMLIDVYANENIADCESYGTAPELNFCSYNSSNEIKYNINQFNDFVKPYMETK